MIKWDDNLVYDIARRKVVLFLGAGVSCNAKNNAGKAPKNWNELLLHLVNNIETTKQKQVKKLIKDNNFLTACELIKSYIDPNEYIRLLEREYQTPRYNYDKIHENIFNLDSRIVITPNIDNIYETYANTITNGDIKTKTYKDCDIITCIRNNAYLIIKMHGTINTPNELIFTHKEYSEARIKYAHFYQIIQALALTHTFFFIGCGQNDPDIRLIFEDQYLRYPTSAKHYFTITKDSAKIDATKIFAETMNLKLIEYSKDNNHKELSDSLEELVPYVRNAREELAKLTNW
jgi:hypothetical protein